MTSVNAGQSAGTALSSYIDSLPKTQSGTPSTSRSRQSAGTDDDDDDTASDTTSPASVVSLSPQAKAMLAQAKDAQMALKALKDVAQKNDSKLYNNMVSFSTNNEDNTDPAGSIFKLINNNGETTGFTVNARNSGGTKKIDIARDVQTSRASASNDDFSTKFYNTFKDSLFEIDGGMSPDEQQTFDSAFNGKSLNIQVAEDVKGLNYHMTTKVIVGPQGGVGGEMTFSSNRLPEMDKPGYHGVIGWHEGLGSYYVTWSSPDRK